MPKNRQAPRRHLPANDPPRLVSDDDLGELLNAGLVTPHFTDVPAVAEDNEPVAGLVAVVIW